MSADDEEFWSLFLFYVIAALIAWTLAIMPN